MADLGVKSHRRKRIGSVIFVVCALLAGAVAQYLPSWFWPPYVALGVGMLIGHYVTRWRLKRVIEHDGVDAGIEYLGKWKRPQIPPGWDGSA